MRPGGAGEEGDDRDDFNDEDYGGDEEKEAGVQLFGAAPVLGFGC